jgi:predicted short-subunit dehydrogenase-like oxidoreductase (DUF2520 family)
MAASRKYHRPSITLVGAGNLASVLGPALKSAGYRIDAVMSRPLRESRRRATALARRIAAKAMTLPDAQIQSDIVWLCSTDDALSLTAARLAKHSNWRGKIVFHSSGALTSDVLAPLQRAGAHVASVHPMMTFAHGTAPLMERVTFAVEGDRKAVSAAREITSALKADSFVIQKKSKVLYHALGSFSSPLLVAALATAERVGRAAGLTVSQARKVTGPILQQTLNNYLARGAAEAYGGPMKRGDISTVRRHIHELKQVPGAVEVYIALIKSALIDLPANHKPALRKLLQEAK